MQNDQYKDFRFNGRYG